jgi:hypothetical protein
MIGPPVVMKSGHEHRIRDCVTGAGLFGRADSLVAQAQHASSRSKHTHHARPAGKGHATLITAIHARGNEVAVKNGQLLRIFDREVAKQQLVKHRKITRLRKSSTIRS